MLGGDDHGALLQLVHAASELVLELARHGHVPQRLEGALAEELVRRIALMVVVVCVARMGNE